jgi:thiol-disulfide isomerase/thioredoxin
MSYSKNVMAVITLVVLIGLIPCQLLAQESIAPLGGAGRRLAEAERQIQNSDDYWNVRERLARQALHLAEEDLDSRDAEEVLRWVLSSPRSSSVAVQAAQHLAEHHGTSKATIEWLLNQQPREWTPDLFASLLKTELPAESRVILEFSKALHDRELLNLSDEIKASKPAVAEYELRLGKSLAEHLRSLDGNRFADQLVESFQQLADKHGERVIGGATIRDLADGAIFAIRHLRLGTTATELAGRSLSDKAVDLNQFPGRVVLVDFWATWCAPCVAAMPQLKQLRAKLGSDRFEILGVSADQDRGVVTKFIADQSVDWPTILDEESKLQKRWMALSLPTYYVLDEGHVVRYRGSNLDHAVRTVDEILGNDAVANLVRLTLGAFDKNNDRRIEKGELPADKQALFDAADLDKDGFWSVDELTLFLKANTKTTRVDPHAPNDR